MTPGSVRRYHIVVAHNLAFHGGCGTLLLQKVEEFTNIFQCTFFIPSVQMHCDITHPNNSWQTPLSSTFAQRDDCIEANDHDYPKAAINYYE